MCSGHTDNYPGHADGSLVSEESSAKNGKAVLFLGRGSGSAHKSQCLAGRRGVKLVDRQLSHPSLPRGPGLMGRTTQRSRQAGDSDRTKTQRLSTFLFNL
ncbi:unnamed protein product [Rangifer tarandus platyrhynchus]|uniref:Uncharacterized protein n=2 Tax=Rangifer tarandus platyrhynchus TaxID=3082113 RepID=A0ABN8ZQ19_RANTA|nr:unnamed protein product [Rangifer tarandus platyrhynchus]